MKVLNPAHFRLNGHVLIASELTGPITADKVEALLDAGAIEIAMRNGKWWRVRRNGQTQRWKRDKNRFRIPIKFGLKLCDAITEKDFVEEPSHAVVE